MAIKRHSLCLGQPFVLHSCDAYASGMVPSITSIAENHVVPAKIQTALILTWTCTDTNLHIMFILTIAVTCFMMACMLILLYLVISFTTVSLDQ